MERKWLWRVIFLVLLIGVSVAASVTTVVRAPENDQKDNYAALRKLFPGINLGLDLQGGLRLIYEVGVDAAIEDKRDHIAESIVHELGEKAKIKNVKAVGSKENDYEFDLVFPDAGKMRSDAAKEVLKDYRRMAVETSESASTVHMELKEEIIEETKEMSIKQAVETIGIRIDKMGLANTAVIPRIANQDIIVQIPGIDEKQISRIKRIIAQTARLELKIVDDQGTTAFFTTGVMKEKLAALAADKNASISLHQEPGSGHYYLSAKNELRGKSGRQILEAFLEGVELPENREISYQEQQGKDGAGNPTADVTWRTYFTEKVAGITGEYIDEAAVAFGEQGKPYVSLRFNQEGAGIFADLTGENVKERMAIILDGKVQSAPVIQEKISGGNCQITLGRADALDNLMAEAKDLVVVLNAGALPAPIKPVTESTIGPQLGDDAIEMGKIAFVIAILVILVFMIIYYKGAGFAADLALVCNGVFIVAILSGAAATLTLPGIAGIILTMGMAVDANVIIYERIREELRGGKSPRAAVDAGFKRAFWTIFDAQITTFIAGVVMFQYGTGAIKGFAVTLLVGIVTSMFSAIFVSRLVLDFMTRRRTDQLSI
ncbi:MAG: protein translocase subunit SecD [Deltaproteobacteria bacterium]|nr:protein translocase subunit SecD [Deltaproteobacteria bacterium]MBN2672779.1 protein translocase subunit SecD [Deltaproteobacteria bacterium]